MSLIAALTAGKKNKKPAADPASSNPGDGTDPGAATDPGTGLPDLDTLTASVSDWAWRLSGFLALAAIIGAIWGIGWLQTKKAERAGALEVTTLGNKMRDAIRLAKRHNIVYLGPVTFTRAIPLTVLAVLPFAAVGWFWFPPAAWVLPVAFLLPPILAIRRTGPVRQAEEFYQRQMFNIANEKLRYKGGAGQVMDQYVQITEWSVVPTGEGPDAWLPQTVVVMFPSSTDVTESRRQDFEMHWTEQAVGNLVWDFTWEPTQNRVLVTAQPPIPTTAYFPFPTIDTFGDDAIPMGVTIGGDTCTWKPQAVPHLVVAGKSGSGKSVCQRNMLLHVLQSPRWSVILIDPKRVELSMYKDAEAVVRYAIDEETMNEALEFALSEMTNRYTLMAENGVPFYGDLPERPNALMVMVDEAASLLLETGDKDIDVLKKRNKVIIGRLAREGRAAGVHLVMATQRPDASWLGGDTRETIEGRVAMGKMSQTASQMILNNVLATRTPGDIKGRGWWHDGAEFYPMQSYFFDAGQVGQAVQLANALRSGRLSVEDYRRMLDEHMAAQAGPVEGADSGQAGGKGVRGLLGSVKAKAAARTAQVDDGEAEPDDDVTPSGPGLTAKWRERRAAKAEQRHQDDPQPVDEPTVEPAPPQAEKTPRSEKAPRVRRGKKPSAPLSASNRTGRADIEQ